jgi:translocation and assembly module TamB
MRLAGQDTQLDVSGTVGLHDERIALRTTGDANLGILQGFFRNVRSSGAANVVAEVQGPLRAPMFSGSAFIKNGRIRHFSLPHSLENVNGRLSFDGGGIRLDNVTARLGGGEVQVGGRIGLKGYAPGELNLTAVGQDMRLRYPEGVRSVVDADLTLRGDFYQPQLAGSVQVKSAVWTRTFELDTGLLELAGSGVGRSGVASAPVETNFPLTYDIRIVAPSTLRIENRSARIVASADMVLRGTYDRPLLFGRADIERGEVFFEGNRYFVTRGTIDFANPTRIEPFFDVEAETRVRVPGQTYRVIFHASGTADRFVPELSSDPPLPTIDILALLFGDVRDPQDAELRALRTPQATEQELIRARAARLLASPISSGVGRVVQQTLGIDTVQITPSLGVGDPSAEQSSRLTPGARLTLGKRISDRVFLTYSRALATATRDEVILLEYNQSDRLSWILSQNEDRTYALDFRVRRSF